MLRGAGLFGVGAALTWMLACRGSREEFLTTLDRTIAIGEGGALGYGPGEPREVRTELAEAHVERARRRRSLVAFHHFADLQLLDEESPLRGEWQDFCPTPLSTAAFRPQEPLTPHVAASLVRQANRISRSPVTGRPVDFVVHTGGAADNGQLNELRWFIDLMDGRRLEPDSGGPGYEGVQSESPDARFPELLGQAQLPFVPGGIRYPWYTALGNRDVLSQGNFPPSEASNGIAVGDEKIIDISPARREEVCEDPAVLLDPDVTREILEDAGTEVRKVTPDPDRLLLSRREWVEEMLDTAESPGPVGHGLTEENRDGETAYYVFAHGPLAFIVLDTVNPSGFSEGSIDQEQFEWLEGELQARSGRYYDDEGKLVEGDAGDMLIVVVSHHGLDRMDNPLSGPDGEERVRGPELEALLHRYPNVVAHVAGHSHANNIAPRPDPDRRGGSYWEITTTSPVAFPMQARLLEVADNGDGTLSIFSTMYDLRAPPDPRSAEDPTPGDGVNEEQLAAVARAIAAADPQRDVGQAGLAVSDRNAELLLPAAFDLSQVAAPGRHRPAVAGWRRRDRRALLRLLAPGG